MILKQQQSSTSTGAADLPPSVTTRAHTDAVPTTGRSFGADIQEITSRLDAVSKQAELKAADLVQRSIHKVLKDKLESDTLLEGRAAEFSVAIEKKLIARIERVKHELLQSQLEKEA
jgi:hypothetical protein